MPETQLIKILKQVIAILERHGISAWADWFKEDIRRLSNGDDAAVEHVLAAFGGMGSFNDLVICVENGHQIAKTDETRVNQELGELATRLYDTAQAVRRD